MDQTARHICTARSARLSWQYVLCEHVLSEYKLYTIVPYCFATPGALSMSAQTTPTNIKQEQKLTKFYTTICLKLVVSRFLLNIEILS